MPSKERTLAKIGLNLRRLREAAGLTQESLAAAAGCDITYVSGIERGKRNFGVLTLLALSKALKSDSAALLEGAE